MSVRENQSLRLWLFASPIAKVRTSLPFSASLGMTDQRHPDANLFKEAFIKAQQENEALFTKDAGE